MLQLALANLKTHSRRFIAVTLAVMIGTAFLAATLMVNSSTTASLQRSLGEAYSTADLVATPDWINSGEQGVETIGAKALKAVAAVPGVAAVHGQQQSWARVKAGSDVYGASVVTYAADEQLRTTRLKSGVLPASGDQVVVDARYAAEFGISVGDAVVLQTDGDGSNVKEQNINATVVGLSEPSNDPSMGAGMLLTVNDSLFERLAGGQPSFNGILIRTDASAAGTGTTALKASIATALKDAGISPTEVLTAQERTLTDVAQMSGGEDELTMVLLVFALVAFVVTGLVVMNTFSVLIAQRTRELALLRTLGAVRSQIRSSVLIEALVIGLLASVLGVLLATGVMAVLIAVLAANVEGASFAVLSVSPLAVATGIGAGTLMTLVAAWLPARHAMKVAPLAALRPADDATLKNKAGRVRIVFGFILALLGGGLLAVGAVKNDLIIAFGGGLLSFPGILMLCSLFLPKSVSAIGALFRGTGVPARLASLNAVRNPGRTTATATALLIGVTLVSMMMVGAQTAKASLNGTLAENFLVDLTVSGNGSESTKFTAGDVQKVAGIEGVAAVALLNPVAESGGGQTVYAAEAADLTAVLNDATVTPGTGEVLVAQGNVGKSMKVYVPGNKAVTDLQMVFSEASYVDPVITTETAKTLPVATASPDPGQEDISLRSGYLWLKVADGTSPAQVQTIAKELGKTLDVQDYQISGGVLERQMFSQVIDMMLMIVSGLLAVAVFIALIGVANTLSLSVLERTRENSLLRALGLTRSQLRGMLALEAVLIGGVAALLGVILGSLYGALGAQSALGAFSGVIISLPWLQLGSVIGISVLAALIASVAPARRAARLSPVEGLATE